MDNASHPGPTIDVERCTACGCCIDACSSAVFERQGECVVAVHPDNCGGCGECEMVCPEGAVEVSFSIVWGDSVDQPADAR